MMVGNDEKTKAGEAGAGPVGEAVACSSCDGTGDLIRMDGEWLGWCPCGAAGIAGAKAVAWGCWNEDGNALWSVALQKSKQNQTPLYARLIDEAGEVERDSDEESYQIGKRDGYEDAVQHIDERTGGDGQYVAVLGGDPEGRNCPDAPSMVAKIVSRFEAVEHRAETAEVALAETRGENARLETAMLIFGAYLMEKGEAFRTGEGAELLDAYSAAFSPQAPSAPLVGDGKAAKQ